MFEGNPFNGKYVYSSSNERVLFVMNKRVVVKGRVLNNEFKLWREGGREGEREGGKEGASATDSFMCSSKCLVN